MLRCLDIQSKRRDSVDDQLDELGTKVTELSARVDSLITTPFYNIPATCIASRGPRHVFLRVRLSRSSYPFLTVARSKLGPTVSLTIYCTTCTLMKENSKPYSQV